MPELPEIETMVRDLLPKVTGRTVTGLEAPFRGSIRWPNFDEFESRVVGQSVISATRRGKYAQFALASGDVLIVHRGMSGSFLYRGHDEPREPHLRVLLELDDGRQLRFVDPRKFGKMFVMHGSGSERPLPWAGYGPEPLDDAFSPEVLGEALHRRRAMIKPLLLDQRVLAGLGNIYVDESLHRARLHPQRRSHTLSREEIERLHTAIRDVLEMAVNDRGTTFDSYRDIEGRQGRFQDSLRVFRRAGTACPRCGTAIVKMVVGGRGTHICPRCQVGS